MKNEISYINTFFGPVMITYSLTFTDNGCDCDGEVYDNIDEARDVAFEWSAETNRRVAITEAFGASSNLIETVLA
jgi:hypothetical protein